MLEGLPQNERHALEDMASRFPETFQQTAIRHALMLRDETGLPLLAIIAFILRWLPLLIDLFTEGYVPELLEMRRDWDSLWPETTPLGGTQAG